MLFRARRAFGYWRFDRAIAGILDTPPLILRPARIRVVSMLGARDVALYLLAIKSFYGRMPGGSVEVLDDGSLSVQDIATLRRHVPGVEVHPLAAIPTGPCPRGGCWERLLHILDRSAEEYVVQLDSDILASAALPEVVEAIAGNRSFTLGSGPEFGIVAGEEAAGRIHPADDTTQGVAERALAALPSGLGRNYVRGSAGFAGFARGAATRAVAEEFSAAMQATLGGRWNEWGTEQVASNHIVANAPGGFVLPWDRYACHYGDDSTKNAALLHFIGTWRFSGGTYARRGRAEIARLMRAGQDGPAG